LQFYRIVFRYRFHRSEKRDDSKKKTLIETLLNDFNFTYRSVDEMDHLFFFFYNLHNKMRKGDLEDIQGNKFRTTPFEVFDEFNQSSVETFLNDEIGSQLVFFFLNNYAEIYISKLSGVFKDVEAIIRKLKESYINQEG
jgi:hypothetical protein